MARKNNRLLYILILVMLASAAVLAAIALWQLSEYRDVFSARRDGAAQFTVPNETEEEEPLIYPDEEETDQPVNPDKNENALQCIIPDERHVRFLGRCRLLEDTLWLPMSGSGAEFQFSGNELSVTLCGDETSEMGEDFADRQARTGIFVNGKLIVDSMMDEPEKTFELVSEKEEGEYTVRVLKLSEAIHSTVGIKQINVNQTGRLEPTAKNKILIEFIGDSICCGYGVDAPDAGFRFSTTTENITGSYAYRTAELLDADYSMVCYSGYGVVSGYVSDPNNKNTNELVADYYDKLGYSIPYYRGQRPQDQAFDFDRKADAVVVNLGTNDRKYVNKDDERKAEFVSAYCDFLEKIHLRNPGAKLVCTLGIMGDELYPQIKEAAAAFSEKHPDTEISCMHFEPMNPQDGTGANGHPSAQTQKKAAEKLAGHLKKLLKS